MSFQLRAAAAAALLAAAAPAASHPAGHAAHHRTAAQERLRLETRRDAGDRIELTLSGARFTSRDDIEGLLLYRAARIAKTAGRNWFILLHLPGETGTDDHPAVRTPGFGAAYAHWQPHWSYYLASGGWQPWHPEWGAPFWADSVRAPERFEAHAMIQLGHGSMPRDAPMAFDADRILRALGPGYARRRLAG